MSKKMFPGVDSVDMEGSTDYTAHEIRRIADALERISFLLESGSVALGTGTPNLENGIACGASPTGAQEVLTVSEAAKLLRISLPKMYELLHDGKVHSVSVGRKILVSRSSIMDYIREGE